MKCELLVLHVVSANPHAGRFHERLSAGVFPALADDGSEMIECPKLTNRASRLAAPQTGDPDDRPVVALDQSVVIGTIIPEVHLLDHLTLGKRLSALLCVPIGAADPFYDEARMAGVLVFAHHIVDRLMASAEIAQAVIASNGAMGDTTGN
jgi:hypothetical protein